MFAYDRYRMPKQKFSQNSHYFQDGVQKIGFKIFMRYTNDKKTSKNKFKSKYTGVYSSGVISNHKLMVLFILCIHLNSV